MVAAVLPELAGSALPGGARRQRTGGIHPGGGSSAAGAHHHAGRVGEIPEAGHRDTVAAGDGRAFRISRGSIRVGGNVGGKQERDCLLGTSWISYGSGGEKILFGED